MANLVSAEFAAEALAGATADAVTAVILYPLDVMKSRAQTDKTATAWSVAQELGPIGLYKGVSDKLIVSPQQKFQFFWCESILHELFHMLTKRKPNTFEHLALGYFAALQGLATTLPLDVTMVRRIAARKKRLDKNAKEESFVESFKETCKTDGFSSFYAGFGVSALLCMNPAITFVCFDRIKSWVLKGRKDPKLSSAEAFVTGALAKIVATLVTFPLIRVKAVLNTWTKLHGPEEPVPTSEELLQRIWKEDGFLGFYVGIGPQLTKGVLNSALMLMLKERIDEFFRSVFGIVTPVKP